MEQNLPARRNTFVLVAVILFNLIWIALLFLSCQADNDPNPTATPIVYQPSVRSLSEITSKVVDRSNNPVAWMATEQLAARSLCIFACPPNYSVPLYKPPST